MSRTSARALLALALGSALIPFASAQDTATSNPTPPPAPPAASTDPAFAPVPAGAAIPPLSIEECVSRALQKNFDLKIEGFNTDVARESLNVAKAAFEPTFTGGVTRSSTQTPDGGLPGGARTDFTDTRIGIAQNITTGATVNVSGSVDRNGYIPAASPFNPIYNSDVAITVVQPLLRGAGTAVNRAQIERSKLGITIANVNYQGRVLQVVRDTEAAYYNLVFARGQLAVKQHSLELAQRLYDENKTRKTTGVATDLDVLSAEVGVANARNGVVQAEQSVHNSEDALLALIGQFEFNQQIGTVTLPPYDSEAVSFDRSYHLARGNQPDYVATEYAIKQLDIDAHTAKNSRLPTLNVGGTVGYAGLDNSYHGAVSRATDPDGYNWELDLTVAVPWGLHADRARYRSAVATLRQQQARLEQIDQNLVVQVRSAVRAVEANQQSVDIYVKATELADRQYQLELARFKAGLSTSRQVLETQDDLETARVNELLGRVNLRIALANLHQLDTTSLQRFHIAIAKQ